jgi:lactate dehydrogenase-like 2-hydroxyacid dehydrogenase
MTKKNHLLLVNDFHKVTIDKLDSLYETHKLWQLDQQSKEQLILDLGPACKAVAAGSWSFDDVIYQLPKLELISCFGVGVDLIDFDKTRQRNIHVTNTPDVLNDAVADLALALILATSRNILNADRFVRGRKWLDGPFPFGRGLAGKVLGIAGLGRIGEAIVHRALPFKLEIAYHNRSPKQLPYTYYSTLLELAQNSDILLCMLPGEEETNKIINYEILQHLGPDGVFINVGRGSSVDEAALAQALREGVIAGAGLDVYADEPQVPDELMELDNIVLLPHIGSGALETRVAMGNLVLENLAAYFAGQPLVTEVP